MFIKCDHHAPGVSFKAMSVLFFHFENGDLVQDSLETFIFYCMTLVAPQN